MSVTTVISRAVRLFARSLVALTLLLSGTHVAMASASAVSFTTSDPDGVAWTGGTYTITFVTTNGSKPSSATSAGLPFTQTFTGPIGPFGSANVTLTDTSTIVPARSLWQINICPNLTATTTFCAMVQLPIVGASVDISAQVNAALPLIRMIGGPMAKGYSDVEFPSQAGTMYYNMGDTTPGFRCFSASWGLCGASGATYNPAGVQITGGTIDGTPIGQTTPAPGSFTTLESPILMDQCTADTTGAAANHLLYISSPGNCSVTPIATSLTSYIIGIAPSSYTAGQTVNYTFRGHANCVADNAWVAGDLLGVGATTPGACYDLGTTNSTVISNSVQIVGRAVAACTAGTACPMHVLGADSYGGNINPVANLSATGTISIAALTPATASNNYGSPALSWMGNYWNGSATAQDTWSVSDVLGTGTNPSTTLTFAHAGSSGNTTVNIPYGVNVASMVAAGNITGGSLFSSQAVVVTPQVNNLIAQFYLNAPNNANIGAEMELVGDGATTPTKYIQVHAGLFMVLANNGTTRLVTVDDFGNTYIAGNLTTLGNTGAIGSVWESLSNTAPSATNSGIVFNTSSGTGQPTVAGWFNGGYSTNNTQFQQAWVNNCFSNQFANDTSTVATSALSICGGYASGITGITSNSGPGTWAHTGSFSATGNIVAQGTLSSTINTTIAGPTNTGISLGGASNYAIAAFYNQTYTANNRTAQQIWFNNCLQTRFASDAGDTVVTPFSVCGGQGTGITGITSNSGSGSWAHTGNFSATGTGSFGDGTQPTVLTVNGKSNGALASLINIQDQTAATGNNFSFNYFAPNLPTGGSLVYSLGKAGSNGNSLVLFWNQTASTATNNWCLTVWGNGAPSNCTLSGNLGNVLTSKNNTLDDGTGNASDLLTHSANQFYQRVTTITASATPAISLAATNGGLQTITLSANATPTITGIAVGARVTFQICQPATGGPYTWAWPAAVHGGVTIGTIASTCSTQAFVSYTGTTLVPDGDPGVINVAP